MQFLSIISAIRVVFKSRVDYAFSSEYADHTIVVDSDKILEILTFLKLCGAFRFNSLVDLFCIDHLRTLNRFELNYVLLSPLHNERLCVKVFVSASSPVPSSASIFRSANWLEREIWDLYGVFFSNHPDLRRILTDYGFDGHPFRKDFPLSGYVEVRYDEEHKRVLLEPVSLVQELRYFDFVSPWENQSLLTKR